MAVERRASAADIDRLIEIRGAVRENQLSNPLSVTRSDYDYFVGNGLVWVAEVDATIAGFSAGTRVMAQSGHCSSIPPMSAKASAHGFCTGRAMILNAVAL